MDTNTVQLVTTFGNKLDAYISVLAAKAGMAAEQFWPVLVKQQVIEGWGGIVMFVFCVLCFGLSIKLLINSLTDSDNDCSNRQFVGSVIGAIVGIVFFAVSVDVALGLPQNVSKVCNPEYHAITSLVKIVK